MCVHRLMTLFLVFISLGVKAETGNNFHPNKELYKSITNITGVSLRDAYNAIISDNSVANKKLLKIRGSFDLSEVEKTLKVHLQKEKDSCESLEEKRSLCHGIFEANEKDVDRQIDILKSAERSTDTDKNLYVGMTKFTFKISQEVFTRKKNEWENHCGKQETINANSCKDLFMQVDDLMDLSGELVKLAFFKAEKRLIDFQWSRRVDKRLRVYESH
jgi:hypothetical protein